MRRDQFLSVHRSDTGRPVPRRTYRAPTSRYQKIRRLAATGANAGHLTLEMRPCRHAVSVVSEGRRTEALRPKVGHPREDAMFPVHLRLPQNDLAAQMSAMRTWLDRQNVEVSGFSYREGNGCLVACLEFRVKRQAEAFSAWFVDRRLPAEYRLGQASAGSVALGMPGSVVPRDLDNSPRQEQLRRQSGRTDIQSN